MQTKTTTETAGRARAIGSISRRALFIGAGALAVPVPAAGRLAPLPQRFDALYKEYVSLYAHWIGTVDGDDGEKECWDRLTDIEQQLIVFPCNSVEFLHQKLNAFQSTESLLAEISDNPSSLLNFFKSLAHLEGGDA